jgi:hypothetical protein
MDLSLFLKFDDPSLAHLGLLLSAFDECHNRSKYFRDLGIFEYIA